MALPNKYIKRNGKEFLISLDDALKLCRNTAWMQRNLKKTSSINALSKYFRNEFVHYVPKTWLIVIHGLPQIVLDILNIINFLTLESGKCIHLGKNQKNRIKFLLNKSKELILKGQLYKGYSIMTNNKTCQ